MPLGLFLALAGVLVAPGFRRRDAQIGDRPPVLGPPDFRILAEIADQNDLVHASRHRRSPLDIAGKNHWPAAAGHRLQFLTCRQFLDLSGPLVRVRFRTSGATLYAAKRRGLSDPSASQRLSTYSIDQGDVPALFRKYPAALRQTGRGMPAIAAILSCPVAPRNHGNPPRLYLIDICPGCGFSVTAFCEEVTLYSSAT